MAMYIFCINIIVPLVKVHFNEIYSRVKRYVYIGFEYVLNQLCARMYNCEPQLYDSDAK